MGAVKFGNKADEERFGSLIANFDAVSVRETDLQSVLAEKFKISSALVCDPVFLIGREGWNELVDKSLIPEHPYVFYYNHQKLNRTTKFANMLSKEADMPVIEMRGEVSPFHYSSRYRMTADAQEFISLLSGASYVVTSSFHGVALSICLQKQFFFFSNSKKSNRIKSLVTVLNLDDREINSCSLAKFSPIDYTKVNPSLDELVGKSKKWLGDNLK